VKSISATRTWIITWGGVASSWTMRFIRSSKYRGVALMRSELLIGSGTTMTSRWTSWYVDHCPLCCKTRSELTRKSRSAAAEAAGAGDARAGAAARQAAGTPAAVEQLEEHVAREARVGLLQREDVHFRPRRRQGVQFADHGQQQFDGLARRGQDQTVRADV